MLSATAKTHAPVLFCSLAFTAIVHAQCPVNSVIVKGHVENPTADSKIRVELVYPKNRPGEAGETTLEDGTFQIPIEFVTEQSSIFTNLPRRCGRKPKTVVITWLENGQEAGQVSLDFSRNFKMADASAYTPRSEIVLRGPR